MHRRLAFILTILLGLGIAGAVLGQASVDDVIAKLSQMTSGMNVNGWRYVTKDVPEAVQPAYDDSTWQTGNPEFTWSDAPLAWLRTTVTIPERVGGIPVAGSKVVFRAGVDDDGECYVNGELKQKFHWDQCAVTLTESARPGDKYVIVIKGLNAGGPGRLLSASLDYSVLDDIQDKAAGIIGELQDSQKLISAATDKAQQESMQASLNAAVSALDTTALDRGDKQAFLASAADARKKLEPVSRVAKEYTVHLIGHSHIDMNWLWLWPETLDVCRNTFTTVLKLMDEFPEMRYSQSQASTYIAVEEADPQLFAQIQKRVKSGQWEITGGTWVEGDMNMPSGESIVRQILYAKQYFKEKFGVEPIMCWEPDTFGHAWTVPQILAKSGIKYYYFCRCGKNERVFWWEAPDGSRVLAWNRGWYDAGISDRIMDSPLDINQRYGVKDGMFVHGLGDHGGGLTRQDITTAIGFQKRDVFPTVKFDTTSDFYGLLEKSGKSFPVIRDELNFEFQGCYTSHSDIKKWNRTLENLLPAAETFSSLAIPFGFTYPGKDFATAWRNMCFNQFHDIFDGTAIHGSYDYSRKLFDKARGVGDVALARSLSTIMENVNTSGRGIPVVVFNPLSWARTDVVRMAVPESLRGKAIGVRDQHGAEVPAQVLGDQIVFVAKDVPSVGYKVFHIHDLQTRLASLDIGGAGTIENEFFKVTLDDKTGAVSSIFDKKANREVLDGQGDQLQCMTETGGGWSAWNIGDIAKAENAHPVSCTMTSNGPISVIHVKHDYDKSSFIQDIVLYPGVPRIDFRMTADWGQTAAGGTGLMLKVAFPVDVKDGKARFEIPFGSIERPTNGAEVPAQKWIDISSGDYGVSLLNDCKYGFDVKDNTMRMTLIRTPDDPDPRSDFGRHEINYSLYPHAGDWKQADTVRRGYEFNNPLIPVVATGHAGKMPAEYSFLKVEPSNVIVTALKRAESGDGLILRYYECTGTPGTATITLGTPATDAWKADLMERSTKTSYPIRAGKIQVPVGKWEIGTLLLRNLSYPDLGVVWFNGREFPRAREADMSRRIQYDISHKGSH